LGGVYSVQTDDLESIQLANEKEDSSIFPRIHSILPFQQVLVTPEQLAYCVTLWEEPNILSISEVLSGNQYESVSVDGIVKQKSTKSNYYNGLPNIVLSIKDCVTPDLMEIYLSTEFYTHALLGLLPGSKVRIRNLSRKVSKLSNAYCKCTQDTQFSVDDFGVQESASPPSSGFSSLETMLLREIVQGAINQKMVRAVASIVEVQEATFSWKCSKCAKACTCGGTKELVSEVIFLIDDGSIQAHLISREAHLTWALLCKSPSEVFELTRAVKEKGRLRYHISLKQSRDKFHESLWKNHQIYRQLAFYCKQVKKDENPSNNTILQLCAIRIEPISCQEEAYRLLRQLQ
jgi:hypothetical protein